jgi:hypothetical protein
MAMPPFLHGSLAEVEVAARREGRRCAERYRREGVLRVPDELIELPPGEIVIAHEVVDFQRERPAWRLHMAHSVLGSLCEALDWQNWRQVCDAYEVVHLHVAWGALDFAISQAAPNSASRTAARLQAVLRFWDSLRSARYVFTAPDTPLGLDELMTAACGWAMSAWSSVRSTVRERLQEAAERMAQASRDDSINAILREIPDALMYARGLKHRSLLSDGAYMRRTLAALPPDAFERISGARTSDILGFLYGLDKDLSIQ